MSQQNNKRENHDDDDQIQTAPTTMFNPRPSTEKRNEAAAATVSRKERRHTSRSLACINLESKFVQQELRSVAPFMTPARLILLFLGISLTFIPLGIALLHASRQVVQISTRYDNVCLNQTGVSNNRTCHINITVPSDMKHPIFVYYELDNFLQNHKRYVMSRNTAQLRDAAQNESTAGCDPKALDGNKTIVPCGMVAWTLFNDTFAFVRTSGQRNLIVNKTGISWKSDREHKFGKDVYPQNFQNGSLIGGASLNASIPLSEQEDLMVWMRTAPFPRFKKLYGRIEVDLPANETILVSIQNNYNTYSFNGTKTLVLSTTSWLGGKNDYIGIAYIVVGTLCFIWTITLAVMVYIVNPRKLGDPSQLSWNKKLAARKAK